MTFRRTALACLLVGAAIGAGMASQRGRATTADAGKAQVDHRGQPIEPPAPIAPDTTLRRWTSGDVTLLVSDTLVSPDEARRLAERLDTRFQAMRHRLGGDPTRTAGPITVRCFADFESKALATGDVLAESANRVNATVYRVLERGHALGDGLAEASILLGRIGFFTEAGWLEAGASVWLADSWLGSPLEEWPSRLRAMNAWPNADFAARFEEDTYLLTWPAAGLVVRAALAASSGTAAAERLEQAARDPGSFLVPPPPGPATGDPGLPRFGGFVTGPGQLDVPASPSPRLLEDRHLGLCLAHDHGPGNGYLSRRAVDTCRYLRDNVNATAISISPFGYLRGAKDPVVRHRDVVRGAGDADEECDESLIAITSRAHDMGLTVLLAPHLWGRAWCGEWGADDEAGWAKLFTEYRRFARHYAAVAAYTGADIFQAGKELKATSHREAEWRALIQDLRTIYHGPITYGANWDEYRHIAWWDAVDYIGISQYTPVGEREPSGPGEAAEMMAATADELDALSNRVDRPYLLTEIGYTAAEDAWREPWQSFDPTSDTALPELQYILYDGALETYLSRPNCRGIFWWKWFTRLESNNRGRNQYDFPPYGKDAEKALARWYGSVQPRVTGPPPMVRALAEADTIRLYEGLPHPLSAREDYLSEKGRADVISAAGSQFYATAIAMSRRDARELARWSAERPVGDPHKCMFHGDWLAEFTLDGEILRQIICLGCGETITLVADKRLRGGVSEEDETRLRQLLAKYRSMGRNPRPGG